MDLSTLHIPLFAWKPGAGEESPSAGQGLAQESVPFPPNDGPTSSVRKLRLQVEKELTQSLGKFSWLPLDLVFTQPGGCTQQIFPKAASPVVFETCCLLRGRNCEIPSASHKCRGILEPLLYFLLYLLPLHGLEGSLCPFHGALDWNALRQFPESAHSGAGGTGSAVRPPPAQGAGPPGCQAASSRWMMFSPAGLVVTESLLHLVP